MIKIYRDKEWLKEKYLKEKLSTRKIGKLVSVGNKVIQYWLIKYDIPRRSIIPKNINYRDKKWLENKYINEKLSFTQVSKLCNISASTINNWIKIYNIISRSSGEGVHYRKVNHCRLS